MSLTSQSVADGIGESTNWEKCAAVLSTPVKRISLGIRAYGSWLIVGAKTPRFILTIRYKLFSSDERRDTSYV
jgi:hypothetical protein